MDTQWRLIEGEYRPVVIAADGTEKIAIWAPQAGSAEAFLRCPCLEVLYTGTRGVGKTDALLMDFAQETGKGYGADWNGIIFRRTFPELKDIIQKAKKWFPRIWPGAKYNASQHVWTWPKGEMLSFRQFSKPIDYYKYHGHSYPFIGWEELTTWPTDECFKSMFSCSRSSIPGMPRKIRSTTNPYGCVPFGEVLTARGWVDIRQVQVNESVLSVDRDGKLVQATVSARIEQDYSGLMISRIGSGVHMVFTNDHRLPHFNTNRTAFTIKPFHDLPGQACIKRTATGWDGTPLPAFSPPLTSPGRRKSRITQPASCSGEDFAELLGWVVSEGSYIVDRFGDVVAFCISQMKPENRKKIEQLLDRIGFTYNSSANQYMVYARHWATYLASLGRYCHEKALPDWFSSCEEKVLRKCFDAAMLGDGCEGIYHTYSKKLADQMAEIAIKLGYSVYISERTRKGRNHKAYQVNCAMRSCIELNTGNHVYHVRSTCQSVNVQREMFNGEVYCLTVPGSETFFIRQNGMVWLSGNSGHNWVKHRYRLPVTAGQYVGDIITDSQDDSGRNEPPRVAIHGVLDENKVLMLADPDYKQRLRAAARNPSELKAWLEGSWDIVAGGMVDDVWDAKIHVIEPFKIPSGWIVDRAFDWGSTKPFALQWWAESDGTAAPNGKVYKKGTLFLIAQWYGWNKKPNEGLKMLAVEIARQGLAMERAMGYSVQAGPADPSIFSAENGMCIGDDMGRVGMRFVPAEAGPGSRKTGAERLRKYLKASLQSPMEEPGLFIFATCTQWLRTVPVIPRDAKDPEDCDTDAEDHDYDCTRYRCMFKRHSAGTQKLVGV